MAALYPRLRPCIYKDAKGNVVGNALFHRWYQAGDIVAPSLMKGGHPGGVVSGVLGLIELKNGVMRTIDPGRIQFLDNDIFKDYDFSSNPE